MSNSYCPTVDTHLGMWKMQVPFLLLSSLHSNAIHQPFANNIHAAIIGRRFFHGWHPLATGLYAPQFNPIPLPLLALVITVVRHAIIIGIFPLTSAAYQVECVLCDWDTGENQMQMNHFQHEEYGPVSARHISNLRKYKTECLGTFCKLQERTSATAWKNMGLIEPTPMNADSNFVPEDWEPETAED
ncbi:hypothetical protein K439DRAFT_1612824 [Ramaria rubella]|nr:hypothetical protein K439DRAFT_1612824 [Ramaria rubella]